MADKTLVLDLLNVDKTILLGACVTVKFDREVDVTGVGRIPDPASTPLSMQDPPPAIIIPASDSDALAARSQGFCVIVNAVWTPENSFREASKTWKIQVTSGDPDTVRLSDKPNVVPVPPAQQVFDWDGARADITETKALAEGADSKSDTAVTTANDAKAQIANAVASQDSATAQNINTGTNTRSAINTITPTANAKDYQAVGDGTANDAPKLAAIPAGVSAYLPAGTYLASSSVTIAANLVFAKGASIAIPTGVTVTITGAISADARDVFIDQGGKVDLTASPSQYNLAWFRSGSGYINERWDFAKRSMATFVGKQVIIPRPYSGLAGVVMSGTRPFWGFNGPISFADVNNTLTVHVNGEFKAVANCSAFIAFTDAAKPEDVYFFGDIRVLVDPSIVVNVGIDMQACARVTFWGNVVINGAQTSVRLGSASQVAPVGSIRFFQLQCSFFYQTAVSIYGKNPYSVQDVQIDRLSCTAAQVAGLNVVEIRGLVRNINLPSIIYSTDTPKNGYAAVDAANVLLVESNAEGAIFYVNVGQIYQANAAQGFIIQTSSAAAQTADKIQSVIVNRVHAKYQGVAGSFAACTYCEVRDIYNAGDVTIASTAVSTKVTSAGGVRNITNNGSYTTINGYGQQSRGAGVAPAATGPWPIGSVIRETADNKVYVRVANSGTATDFIVLN